MLKKILFGALLTLTISEIKCDGNCDKYGVLLYEEIGCKPIKAQPDDLCPASYDCSHLEEKGAHCFFQGKKYKNREALPEDEVYKSCNGGCFCQAAYGPYNLSISKFTCAAFDCPEYLGGSPLNNPNCMRTYKLTDCCSSGQICPPFDNVSSCKVEGRTYKEGQRFSPNHKCSTCVCQKDFQGKFEEPFCQRKTCGVELRHTEDIRQNCAPVYDDGNARCCPKLWVCSSESDVFSPTEKDNTSAKTCKFGQREIKSGQVLKTSMEQFGKKYELKCDCQLPPLLTCIVDNHK